MAKVDFMQKLLSFKGAIKEKRNVHANVLETPSPSLNYIFGKGWGLPIGFTMMLMGPPRGGKTVICNAMIGQLLKNDPTAFAAKFDTERREEGQMTPLQEKAWGIDNDRYVVYQTRDRAGFWTCNAITASGSFSPARFVPSSKSEDIRNLKTQVGTTKILFVRH